MKKKHHSYGVLLALSCCTLAYAATSTGARTLFKQIDSSVKQFVGLDDDSKKSALRTVSLTDAQMAMARQQVDVKKGMLRAAADSTSQSAAEMLTDVLWGEPNEHYSIVKVSDKECVITGNTISFDDAQGNVILTAVDEDKTAAWNSKVGYTYHLKSQLKADSTTEVVPCIAYSKEGDSGLYILVSESIMLDSTNNYTADVNLSSTMIYNNAMMYVAYLTYNEEGNPVKITASGNQFYADCKVRKNTTQWTDSTQTGLGLSSDLYGDKYIYTASDSVTTMGMLIQNNQAYITGIKTSATDIRLPFYIQIDGRNVPVLSLGYEHSLDLSEATSLRGIDLGQIQTVSAYFSSTNITDIYSDLTNPTLYVGGVENIYLHLLYGANRYDYYGFKRVLIGAETPDYPETSNSSYVMKSNQDGVYFGISVVDNNLCVTEIFTDADSVRLPYYARWGNNSYTISKIGNDGSRYSSILCQNAPNLTTISLPYYCNNLRISWNGCSIRNLYMNDYAVDTYWSLPSDANVYVPNQDAFDYYANNDSWKPANLIPYGWDFEWYTVNVGRKGEFAQTYIEMTDANWDLARNVKVTGELNDGDLNNIKNLTNLTKLDLSEAVFSKLPNSFLDGKTSLKEVVLPANISNIPQYAFRGCNKLAKVVAPGVQNVRYAGFQSCTSLTDFDISNVETLENYAFDGCSNYNPTQLSAKLTSINSYAFANTAIKEIVVPEGITQISSYVFYNCHNLTKVVLPSKLKTIGDNAFYGCENLSDIAIPNGVTSIGGSAFRDCSSLQEMILPESITSIGNAAFRNCNKIKEFTLPSNVVSVGGSLFLNCDSLKAIKCKAIMPPTTNSDITYGVDLNHVPLYVAPFAIDAYRAATGWNGFYIIKALYEPVKNIYINRQMTFDLQSQDNAVLQNNPNMTLACQMPEYWYGSVNVGQLTASGDGTLSAGVFDINHYIYGRNSYSNDYRASLVNNAENMRADSVACTLNLQKDVWHFISFQYDVQVADIYGLNNTDFVIRQYNSEKRALGSDSEASTSNWEDVAADGILKAGKGYIIQAANNSVDSLDNRYDAVVVFPSRNTTTKNKLFASTNVIVPLDEYPAEFAHNRSWNLVGNPYPCYYDIHSLQDDFSTPIVLWRGSSYQAYSPIDDDVILRPNEAFFVQRPIDKEEMTFGAEGRMHYADAMNNNNSTPGAKAPALLTAQTDRSVFNFCVEGNNADDRTRIVINEKATIDYNINTDAAKFFAENASAIEIYVSGDVRYDICERPLADGTAKLGIRTAKDGIYTISLNGKNINGWTVILTDTQTGQQTDITAGAYQFEAKAGDAPARFLLTFKRTETTAIDNAPVAPASHHVSIATVGGKKIFEGSIADFKASASAGVYIVTDAGKAYKIVVK